MVKETTCFDVSPCSTLYLPLFHSLFMQIQCCATVRAQQMMHHLLVNSRIKWKLQLSTTALVTEGFSTLGVVSESAQY